MLNRTTTKPLVLAILLVLVAGCGAATKTEASTSKAASGSTAKPKSQGELVKTGFGQSGQYVRAIAEVKNLSTHGGQTVEVSFNLFDAGGTLVKTEEQTASFSWGGQDLIVPVFSDLGTAGAHTKIAKAEATLVVKDEGTFDSGAPIPRPTPVTVAKDEYGAYTAKAQFTNSASSEVSIESDVVCTNAAGAIIGGGNAYSDSPIQPGQTVLIEVDLTVTGKPAACVLAPTYSLVG